MKGDNLKQPTILEPIPHRKLRQLTIGTANKFKRVFERMDMNHDGLIDIKELESGFHGVINHENIQRSFNEYAEDHKKTLGVKEFIKLVAPEDMEISETLLSIL